MRRSRLTSSLAFTGPLVRSEVARQQVDLETAATAAEIASAPAPTPGTTPLPAPASPGLTQQAKPRRYHGTVVLDPARVGRDASRIADEVVTHLVGIIGSTVRVTLEIEADIPAGASDNVVRTVTENGRALKFAASSGFETE